MNEKKLVKKCVKEVVADINNNDSRDFLREIFSFWYMQFSLIRILRWRNGLCLVEIL